MFLSKCVKTLLGAICAAAIAMPAHAEWWEAETAHFVVKSRASEKEAREYALELARFDAALRALQGMEPAEFDQSRANKPTVYRFGRPEDMARIAGASGSGIAGFFIPRAGASVAFAPTRSKREDIRSSHRTRSDTELDPRSVLFHEYTHYFMMQNFPGAYPRWYTEGFAEMMATMRIEGDGSYHIGDPPQYRAYQVFQMRDFPLEHMLDAKYQLRGMDALQHYATGWLLTHYLSFDEKGRGQLHTYLKAIAGGEDSLTAARRIFGDLDVLESKLHEYKDGPFPGLRMTTGENEIEVRMRQLSAVEEEAINAEMLLARGLEGPGEANDVSSDLRGILAGQDQNSHVLELLGSAQIDAKQYADADATAQRILELEPDNSEAWLIRAAAALFRIEDDGSMAEKAREFATKAASNDRQDPRPLIVYYMTYVKTGEEAPAIAMTALETAYPHSGMDVGYRLLLARQLLIENRLSDAQIILAPIAFRGHKTAEPKDENDPSLTRLLDHVQSGNRDAALQTVEKMIETEDEDDNANASKEW